MFKQAVVVLLGLMLVSLTLAENNETTTSLPTTTTKFVPIGSNLKLDVSNSTTTNESMKPIVHAVSAQARKIEMTKLASSADVTAALKSQTNGTGSFVISTTMIAIIAALMLVIIISVSVGTAMFVMRRRFSIWRLNNSKQNLNSVEGNGDGGESSSAGGVNDEKTSPSSSATSPGGVNAILDEENQLISVENKNASVMVENETNGQSNEAAENNDEGEKCDQQQTAQDVSSQSLIVNVLNELSESVANKLDAKSPSSKSLKSGQQIIGTEVDKQAPSSVTNDN